MLRSLLDLKEIALRFVRLSDEHASVKWDALDEEVEQRTLGAGATEVRGTQTETRTIVLDSRTEERGAQRAAGERGGVGWETHRRDLRSTSRHAQHKAAATFSTWEISTGGAQQPTVAACVSLQTAQGASLMGGASSGC